MRSIQSVVVLLISFLLLRNPLPNRHAVEQAANTWYQKQPWLVGSNFIPANAINELEMWQADTFDPPR